MRLVSGAHTRGSRWALRLLKLGIGRLGLLDALLLDLRDLVLFALIVLLLERAGVEHTICNAAN